MPHRPRLDRWPAEGLCHAGETGAVDEGMHRLGLAPQVKRRIQVLGRRAAIAVGAEIGLERQPRKLVQHVALAGDALADDFHVVVGRQHEAVLHRHHGWTSAIAFCHAAPGAYCSPPANDQSSAWVVLMTTMTSCGRTPGDSASRPTSR